MSTCRFRKRCGSMAKASEDYGERYAEDRSKASAGNGAPILAVVGIFSGGKAIGCEDVGSIGYFTVE